MVVLKWHNKNKVRDLVLYEEGNQYSDVTGGWTSYYDNCLSYPVQYNYNDSGTRCIRIRSLADPTGGESGAIVAFTNNKIDLKDYTKIHFLVRSTGTTSGPLRAYRGIFSSKTPTIPYGVSTSGVVSWTQLSTSDYGTTKYREKTLDVSDKNGSYYVGFVQRSNINQDRYAYIKKVWLTR